MPRVAKALAPPTSKMVARAWPGWGRLDWRVVQTTRGVARLGWVAGVEGMRMAPARLSLCRWTRHPLCRFPWRASHHGMRRVWHGMVVPRAGLAWSFVPMGEVAIEREEATPYIWGGGS